MKTKGLRPKRQRAILNRSKKLMERGLRRRKTGQEPARKQWLPEVFQPLILPITAPESFSLIRSPDDVIDHLNDITRLAGPNRVVISDLRHITDFSTDALIAMIAFASDPDFHKGAVIQGNVPENPELADLVRDSGIFGDKLIRFKTGARRKAHGTIFRVTSIEVKATVAKELIRFATSRIFGDDRALKGVFTTMIECMTNTHNWATEDSEGEIKEAWWATVYCDTENRRAYFNFVDTGIGILASIKWKHKIKQYLGLKGNTHLMRDVLEGKIGSRTGLNYRGNGLPAIVKRFHRGQLEKLVIIANDVYADIETDEYRQLQRPFKGTLFHWEISYDGYVGTDGPEDGSQDI